MRIITYEDRPKEIVGLKLLVLSLTKHCPGLPIDVYFPSAPASLQQWISKFPDVTFHTHKLDITGYNVKPGVLLTALRDGADEVVWLDTDIIVAKDLRELFKSTSPEAFVVTEEWFGAPYQGGTYRSQAWNLKSKRGLPHSANSSVMRATQSHVPMLEGWNKFLFNEAYLASQKLPWNERPIHMMSDQELLTALLEAEPFDTVPVDYIKRGRDIAHCFHHQGYHLYQIVNNILVRNKPYFVHGQGARPWGDNAAYRTHLDTSPYTLCAMEYRNELCEETAWMTPRSQFGAMSRRLANDSPWLSPLPLAFVEEMRNQRLLRVWMKRMLGRP